MRLLADQNIDKETARQIALAGNDVVHTSDIGLERASDPELLEYCRTENRVFLTLDKRLNKYLVTEKAVSPSIILLRGYPDDLDAVPDIIAALKYIAQEATIDEYCIYTLHPNKIMRIRLLPLD